MKAFDVPNGTRVLVQTKVATIKDAKTLKEKLTCESVSYLATATDDYKEIDKTLRRRFIDTSISFDGVNEIWLSEN